MTYFIRRLIWLIPTLFLLSLLIFGISIRAPYLADAQLENYSSKSASLNILQTEAKLDRYRKSKGTFAPAFYISLHSKSVSDTLYKISHPKVRKAVKNWAIELGSWEKAEQLYSSINSEIRKEAKKTVQFSKLFDYLELDTLLFQLDQLSLNFLPADFRSSLEEKHPINNFLPILSWHGKNNRYHHWAAGLLNFDLGRSMITNRPIGPVIGNSLKWTLSLGFTSLLIALLITIPLATKAAASPNGWLDRFCNLLFFSLYSIPLFWMASLLIIFFASAHFLNWFPSFGIGELEENMSFFETIELRIAHLTLPLICWTYGSLAIIYRHMRAKLKEEFAKDYMLTARSKGLPKSYVVWKHAFRNSTFPLITLLGAVLPGMIGGSFIIETVFSIPGMGKLTLDAFLQRDYPLIFNISFLACVVTVLGVFLADISYYFADPRLKFSNKNA